MPKYKITVLKDQKKYSIVYEAETENIAKDRVHGEGYSILSVEEIKDINLGNEIIFEIITKNNEIKRGKVISNDIFKTYLKFKDGLGYDIVKFYYKVDENNSEIEKQKVLQDLKEKYTLYKEINKEQIEQKQEEQEKIKPKEIKTDNFYLKKELEKTYKLIDLVLNKIQKILLLSELDPIKKEKIQTIYNSIIKIKTSTNIAKLKEIGELALVKIGELELEQLEKTKSLENKKLLGDTNSLLKQIGSSKKFVEKEKDLNYLGNQLKEQIIDFFSSFKKQKKEKEDVIVVDKISNLYLKDALLLSKYKEKLKQNSREILSNFYLFFSFVNSEKKQDLIIKRTIIKQNIKILDLKLNGKRFSYSQISKGYDSLFGTLIYSFFILKRYLYIVIFIYSIIFLTLLNLDFFSINSQIVDLNFQALLYFLFIFFIYYFLVFSRGIFSLLLNFVILSFLIIFGVVNF